MFNIEGVSAEKAILEYCTGAPFLMVLSNKVESINKQCGGALLKEVEYRNPESTGVWRFFFICHRNAMQSSPRPNVKSYFAFFNAEEASAAASGAVTNLIEGTSQN